MNHFFCCNGCLRKSDFDLLGGKFLDSLDPVRDSFVKLFVYLLENDEIPAFVVHELGNEDEALGM